MTFGEEFESDEGIKKTTVFDEEITEKSPLGEQAAGSTVYEVIASDDSQDLNLNDQADFPRDMGTGESNHEGYNEDAVLYFESKRYKGLKKKTHGNAKFRDTSNSITEPARSNKERVRITSYVADISEVDGKDEKLDERESTPAPRDATTISTFFIAPKEHHGRRTPVRIRKKIIKPVRLGYRKKQNQQYVSDSPPVFRQKVTLVQPPSHNLKNLQSEKDESVKSETFTRNQNDYSGDIIDHGVVPSDDKMYLPIKQVDDTNGDRTPYTPPPQLTLGVTLPDSNTAQPPPEQFFREEPPTFNVRDHGVDLTVSVEPFESSLDPVKNSDSSDTSINFMDVLSQTLINEFRPGDKQVHFVTSKKQKELRGYGDEKLEGLSDLNHGYDSAFSAEDKEKFEKPNFEETNRAEDGLTSSDTILAPIQAAVSLSNHVQQEGKKKSVPNMVIEQQEIRVEPVMKTTIDIQKSIPFEIKEIKPDYNHLSNINLEYEKPLERPSSPPTDFLQQVALAYHKMSNNGDYPNHVHFSSAQSQPQNYVYFYRNRLPQIPLYFLHPNNKGSNDFNKGNVGPYIMQQSYKNLGLDHSRPVHYQNVKYQGPFPSITRPLSYSNNYDINGPLLYHPNIPSNQVPFAYHKGQVQIRLPQGVEQNPNQHLGGTRTAYEEATVIANDEEGESSNPEEINDSTEEIKQGSDIQVQEVKQEVIPEHSTDQPLTVLPKHPSHYHHVSEPPRILNNQPYPYGYSFVYPISTTEFRSAGPYFNYHRRGKAPPFRPSHPMYTSQYPPHTYLVATTLQDRGIHARSINNKKLCIEYGGFKPPLVPSIQIDDEFEKEAQDKSSTDEQIS